MKRHGRASEEVFSGASLTKEEVEFGRAMLAYMHRKNLKWYELHWRDVLREARRIGYRKVTDASI